MNLSYLMVICLYFSYFIILLEHVDFWPMSFSEGGNRVYLPERNVFHAAKLCIIFVIT